MSAGWRVKRALARFEQKEKSMNDAILTDENGKPFCKPVHTDYSDVTSYLRACWAYNDAIANCANRSFAEAFGKALRK